MAFTKLTFSAENFAWQKMNIFCGLILMSKIQNCHYLTIEN